MSLSKFSNSSAAATETCTPELPDIIDGEVAVESFKRQRHVLFLLTPHCLDTLANSLLAQSIIPEEVYERACNTLLSTSERSLALLDCVQSRIEAIPSDFSKVLQILNDEPFLSDVANRFVETYSIVSSLPSISTFVVPRATSSHASYLKILYKNSPISSDKTWPPNPAISFIKLALVGKHHKCRDKEYMDHVLHGNVKEMCGNGREITLEELLVIIKGKLRLVLIEGAPGIGKSSLAWELCRNWDKFSCMKQYQLVILLRLREKKVQKLSSIADLFHPYDDSESNVTVAEEVCKTHGKGVLFILDGFDELPAALQKEGLLVSLIEGRVLPSSTVVVTSRPSATSTLLARPKPDKHVEILGFTQENIEEYARSVFPKPREFEAFQTYTLCSNNPAINSLMYVPLNAAIIAQIFKNCQKSNFPVPHSLTELYTQLSLAILKRHLDSCQGESVNLAKIEDLPGPFYQQFLGLCKIAFDGIVKEEVIFHALPPNVGHFGFLDKMSSLYGGGELSYNFLHLTLQEFLAAYHISQLPYEAKRALLSENVEDKRWDVVFRFVAGLTKFEYLKDALSLMTTEKENEVELSPLLLGSLFEAQVQFQWERYFSSRKCSVTFDEPHLIVPLKLFMLSHCISNSILKAPWKISIVGIYSNDIHSFSWGFKEIASFAGCIKDLSLIGCLIDDLKSYPLQALSILHLRYCELTVDSMDHLCNTIPYLPCLKELDLSRTNCHVKNNGRCLFDKLLRSLCHSNVKKLDISNTDLHCASRCKSLAGLEILIKPSGSLEELEIGGHSMFLDDAIILASYVSAPSSLKHLTLKLNHLYCIPSSMKNNTNLISLTISEALVDGKHLAPVAEIVKENKTLQYLELSVLCLDQDKDVAAMRKILNQLQVNNTLKRITIAILDNNFQILPGDTFATTVYKYLYSFHPTKLCNVDPRVHWLAV